MKYLLIALSLALAGCVNLPIKYEPATPQQQTRGGDIRVRVPHSHDQRHENADGAAACAQYGRISRPAQDHGDNGRDYDCVQPSDYTRN